MATQAQSKGAIKTVSRPLRNWTREEVETLIGRIIKWIFIVFFVVVTAFPFYWMLNLSIRPIGEVLREPTRLVPTMDNLVNFWKPYQSVLIDFRFLDFIRNSLVISVLTVTMTLLLAIPAAYAITRLDF